MSTIDNLGLLIMEIKQRYLHRPPLRNPCCRPFRLDLFCRPLNKATSPDILRCHISLHVQCPVIGISQGHCWVESLPPASKAAFSLNWSCAAWRHWLDFYIHYYFFFLIYRQKNSIRYINIHVHIKQYYNVN